ncbi:MAG: EAL domain-containing protein [Hahellaceae bacterium]|nr:EAL domain-containing protein [Hahellaceae bacterium]
MNKLLSRQIARLGSEGIESLYPKLLAEISSVYDEHENELKLLEHSLVVASDELNDRLEKLNEIKKQLETNLAALAAIFEATGEAIFAFDLDGRLVRSNCMADQLAQRAGLGKKGPVTQAGLVTAIKSEEQRRVLADAIVNEPVCEQEGILELSDKHAYEFRYAPQMIGDKQVGRVWCLHDISHQKSTESIIEFQAYHDSLTCLPNRALLNIQLKRLLQLARQSDKTVSILFIDLDGLHKINDTFGHEVGDSVLISAAERINACLEVSQILARFGAAKFVVVIDQLEAEHLIKEICTNILNAFSAPFYHNTYPFQLQCTIGVSEYPFDGLTPNAILGNADLAKCFAKKHGKTVQYYTSHIKDDARERVEIEAKIRKALEEDQFELYLQPEVLCESEKIYAAEALIRWRGEDGQFIPPDRFIPIAEESGLINAISNQVLKKACGYLKQWQQHGIDNVKLSVNLSVADISDNEVVDTVIREVKAAGVPPGLLVLEVTESLLLANKDTVKNSMNQLKQFGVQFALDDFGTGYSSLSYLQDLPFSYLKVDKSFIRNLSEDRRKQALVKAIFDIAENLELIIVAEGVEDQPTYEFICNTVQTTALIQGYYCHRPMPFSACTELLLSTTVSDVN